MNAREPTDAELIADLEPIETRYWSRKTLEPLVFNALLRLARAAPEQAPSSPEDVRTGRARTVPQGDGLISRLTRRCTCQRCSECDDERREAAAALSAKANTLADINDALRIALGDDIEGMERERIEDLAARVRSLGHTA